MHKVKDGLILDVEGYHVFLPQSQIKLGSEIETNLEQYIGQALKVQVVEISKNGKDITVSCEPILNAKVAN